MRDTSFIKVIQDNSELEKYYTKNRAWQGIPGIEITDAGRMFACFYSGGETEQLGNFCLLIKSDDKAKTWSEPITVIYAGADSRVYDPCLWIDPNKRLWFIFSISPIQKTYAIICNNPSETILKWSKPIVLGEEVMMNKPTVLSNGEWVFPIAVWGRGIQQVLKNFIEEDKERKAFCYTSFDEGKFFRKTGGIEVDERSFDEHMFLELKDGRLAVYVRTTYGIAVSYSLDKGKTWSKEKDTGLFGPDSRFFIRRLSSGNILLVNHAMENEKTETIRKNLTAYISKDEGETWQGGLLLDERVGVSYPDGVQTEDGYIYVIYDRDRKGTGELALAKFNEQDVLAKSIKSNGYIKRTISILRKG